MVEVFANSEDPEQTPCSVASDLGLHCLPITLLRVSQLQWVNGNVEKSTSCIQPPLTVEFRYYPFMPSGLFYIYSLDQSISNKRDAW